MPWPHWAWQSRQRCVFALGRSVEGSRPRARTAASAPVRSIPQVYSCNRRSNSGPIRIASNYLQWLTAPPVSRDPLSSRQRHPNHFRVYLPHFICHHVFIELSLARMSQEFPQHRANCDKGAEANGFQTAECRPQGRPQELLPSMRIADGVAVLVLPGWQTSNHAWKLGLRAPGMPRPRSIS